ncbi:MAG: hypothetical protein PHE70_11075 [Tepidanaerobacteraceae bacterium]|nr:hypothetical protein [Tepidanaerobacteraceae bacterium]
MKADAQKTIKVLPLSWLSGADGGKVLRKTSKGSRPGIQQKKQTLLKAL